MGKTCFKEKRLEKWGVWYALFQAPKTKYCLLKDNYGNIPEHKTFKGYTDVNRNLARRGDFKMFDGQKLVTKQALSWKKQFIVGVVIPSRNRNCAKCTKGLICTDCDKENIQKKVYASNLNDLKRKPPNIISHMLPHYEEE